MFSGVIVHTVISHFTCIVHDFTYWKIYCAVLKLEFSREMLKKCVTDNIVFISWDHPFSTYAKFSEKLRFTS